MSGRLEKAVSVSVLVCETNEGCQLLLADFWLLSPYSTLRPLSHCGPGRRRSESVKSDEISGLVLVLAHAHASHLKRLDSAEAEHQSHRFSKKLQRCP